MDKCDFSKKELGDIKRAFIIGNSVLDMNQKEFVEFLMHDMDFTRFSRIAPTQTILIDEILDNPTVKKAFKVKLLKSLLAYNGTISTELPNLDAEALSGVYDIVITFERSRESTSGAEEDYNLYGKIPEGFRGLGKISAVGRNCRVLDDNGKKYLFNWGKYGVLMDLQLGDEVTYEYSHLSARHHWVDNLKRTGSLSDEKNDGTFYHDGKGEKI